MTEVISVSSISSWISSSFSKASFLSLVGFLKDCFTQSFNAALVFFNFLSQTKFGEPVTRMLHALVIMGKKLSLSIHKGLNRKGMGKRSSSSSSYNKIGLCSVISLGKILEEMIFFHQKGNLNQKSIQPTRHIVCSCTIISPGVSTSFSFKVYQVPY